MQIDPSYYSIEDLEDKTECESEHPEKTQAVANN